MNWTVEQTHIGRITVPARLADGVAVFCTSSDFEGRLTSESVDAVRGVLLDRFGCQGSLASCGQVHGGAVANATGTDQWHETPGCDALVSTDDQVALAIKIADCLPISIHDARTATIAAAHSGWRGAAADIVSATIARMSSLHGTKTSDVRAWLGPSIRVCCFEVGEEVVDALRATHGDIGEFVDRSRGAKPHVDLSGLTTRILVRTGVSHDAIDDSGICTRCDDSIFHSFRRDRDASGRNLMVIGLRNR